MILSLEFTFVQRNCGCLIPAQGQLGEGLEQTGIVKDVTAHGRDEV